MVACIDAETCCGFVFANVLQCTPPKGGQKRKLKLELRVVADVGLIGVPNAGNLLECTLL